MREIDWKHMMERLDELARWLDAMEKLTHEPGMKRKHKERAKAVREAVALLEDYHDQV